MRQRTWIVLALGVGLLVCFSGCGTYRTNKAQQGSVFGALAGGLLGSQLGPADNRGENALIGAGLGLMAGYLIGNEMDKYDQQRVQQTLEYQPSNQASSWVNPDTGNRYRATPGPAYAQDGRIYRNIELEARVDGQREVVDAQAYRENGRWVLVQ